MKPYVLFLLLLPFTSSAQKTLQATLLNSETKQPISYATISIPSLKKSTISKKDGRFAIEVPENKTYDIQIDAWSYHKKNIRLDISEENTILYLDEAPEMMPEMFIPPSHAKIVQRTYGRTHEGSGYIIGRVQTYTNDNYAKGVEFGMIVKNKGLSEVKSFHIHIKENTYKRLVYRLSFYEVSNGKPSQKINHEEILFSIGEKYSGWLKVDLSKKYIFLDNKNKNIALVLSLVDLQFNSDEKIGNLDFHIGTALSNPMVIKENTFEPWQKFPFNIPMYITVDTYE